MADISDMPMTDKRAESIADYLNGKVELLVNNLVVTQVSYDAVIDVIASARTLEDIDWEALNAIAIEEITRGIDMNELLADYKQDVERVLDHKNTDWDEWKTLWGKD